MNTMQRLLEIASRLEHLEGVAEWIAREMVHTDPSVSQTGTLICTIADDVQARITDLVRELEELGHLDPMH